MLAALLLALLASDGPPSKVSELSLLQLVARLPTPAEYLQLKNQPAQDPRWEVVLEFESRMSRGEQVGFEEWKCLLLDRHWLRWRDRWPRAEPFAVGFPQPPFCEEMLELVPHVPGWKSARSVRPHGCEFWMHQAWAADYQVLGPLPKDESTIVFDLVRGSFARGAGSPRNGLGTIELRVRAMGSAEECLTPLRDPKRGTEIATSLATYLYCRSRDASGSGECQLRLADRFQPPAGVAVGLEAVLLHEGAVDRRSWLVVRRDHQPYLWEDGGPWTANFIHAKFDPLTEAERLELGRQSEGPFDRLRVPGNTLRLRGSALRALRDWEANEYWAGEIELPLADLIRR